VVVAHREQLWWLLAEAAQLEHMIMCEYLYAEFSLKDSGDGLGPGQAEAVGRWRTTLREIAVQEMLHLALVSNLMTAIGRSAGVWPAQLPAAVGVFPGRGAA
jgi:Ferritin-like